MTKTRIIATIGPVSNSADILIKMNLAGMTVARLNGSHNTLQWHAETIALIRKTIPNTPILLDIPGRKIRTLLLKHEPKFSKGDIIILTTDTTHNGEKKVPVGYSKLHERLNPGDKIFADDGTLSFNVEKIDGKDIHIRADMGGTLKSRKGINVPGIDLGQSLVTDKDKQMITFAKENNVDYIGISFVESAQHIEAIRTLIGGDFPKIVAKVENSGGIANLGEVIDAADVIMIDRGDLAVETSIDNVALYQKKILQVACQVGKPTIVATELLHSMIENPLPTKAEVSDITNAVLDGAAAVMLSGETAVGRYPVESVTRITSIARLAENHHQSGNVLALHDEQNDIRKAINALTEALPITRIIVFSRTGYSVRIAAMANTGLPIVAVGSDTDIVRSWNLLPGVNSLALEHVDLSSVRTEHFVLKALLDAKLIEQADFVLLVSAQNDNQHISGNILRTVSIKTYFSNFFAQDNRIAEKVA